MKKSVFKDLLYASAVSVVLLQSCSKENLYEEEIVNPKKQAKIEIVKDFEIQPEWFDENTLKAGDIPIGSIYNNFGEGYDNLTNLPRNYIFIANKSLEPIVSTTLEEQTKIRYVASSNYSSIDESVNSEFAASLGVSVAKVRANTSISISNQSRVSSNSSSVYVSVLYIMRYGKGVLRFNDASINNYLIYKTNFNSGQATPDGINISSTTFRNLYGDVFKSSIYFGCVLNATVQICNVNFSNSTDQQIKASAEAAVGKMVEANATWEQSKTTNKAFYNSSIVIDGDAIPSSNFIGNIEELRAEIKAINTKYASHSLGVILNTYERYSMLYPWHSFFNDLAYTNKIDAYKTIINKWDYLLKHAAEPGKSAWNEVKNDIILYNSYIERIKNLENIPYPDMAYYDNRYADYLKRIIK